MKNINLIILTIIVAATLIFSGCTNQEVTGKSPYVGGVNALTVEFQSQRPPDTIYSGEIIEGEVTPGSSFSVGVILKNLGEQGIFYEEEEGNDLDFKDFGRLTLKGINPVYFDIESDDTIMDFETEEVSLRANKIYLADGTSGQGGMINMQFPAMSYQYTSEGFTDLSLTVDLCYNYKTRSTTNICIVTDYMNRKICNPAEVKMPSNSGAPVQLKSITQQPAGKDKISMIIELAQTNPNGMVFAPIEPPVANDELVCDETETNPDKDKVYVKVSLPEGNEDISCTDFKGESEGTIQLNRGAETIIFCDINTEGIAQDYETQLSVDLYYSYGQYIDKTITLASR
jgi:hypothetical protein